MQLRVIEPFGGREQGDLIDDAKEIAAVLASAQAQYVVQVAEQPVDAAKPSDDTK